MKNSPNSHSANDPIPPIGSVWEERDGRFTRRVTVVHGFDPVEQRIRIKGARITWARIARFNGKSGGYRRIS